MREPPPDAWMIGLTIGLLLVAAAQAWMFRRQLRIMTDGLRDTKQAADAATASVALAKDTAERQLRAYVLLLGIEVDISDTIPIPDRGKAAYILTIKNWGLTPAYNVEVFTETRLLPRDARPTLVPSRMPGVSKGTMPPDSTVISHIAADSGEEIQRMMRRNEFDIVLFGRIEYVDTFGVQRYSNFRHVRERLSHAFRAASEGNESN